MIRACGLVAWRGESTPLAEGDIFDRPRWNIIRDDDWRITLVLWEPLHVGDAEIGSIRVTQNLFVRAPVRNSVLDNYDITNIWTRQTGLEVQVDYGGNLGENTLRSIDGSVLGTYTVTPPTEATLIATTAAFYDNLMAAGMALLVLWLVWGIWRWFRSAPKLFSLMIFAGVLSLGRIAWLYLEVPARYQTGKAPLSPLFDPVHLASTVGGGLMRTTGDLFIGALCVLILGFAVLRYANAKRKPVHAAQKHCLASSWRWYPFNACVSVDAGGGCTGKCFGFYAQLHRARCGFYQAL